MLVNTRTIIVEWGHCDPGAIVYFPRYFEWFDAGTAALFEDAGIPKAAMLSRFGCAGIPVVDLRTRFITPSTFGDRVTIESSITAWRRSSFDLHHRLLRGDEVAVEAFVTRVWTVRGPDGRLKSGPTPAEVIALFSAAERETG
jgi:4-hydroxybenzoyl-CoA thioesterase